MNQRPGRTDGRVEQRAGVKIESGSLTGRAILAVVLMVGFYLLAIGMIGTLLFIPYAELAYAHRLHLKLVFGCLVGAGAIAWSILPRFDSFGAPGPRLTEEANPKLCERARGDCRAHCPGHAE